MRYHIVTLGCPKNVADSDGMTSLLRAAGYESTPRPDEADVLVVNTCGFLQAARAESLGVLQELAATKRPGQRLIAAGCLVQRYADDIQAAVPSVDAMLGTHDWPEIAAVVGLDKPPVPALVGSPAPSPLIPLQIVTKLDHHPEPNSQLPTPNSQLPPSRPLPFVAPEVLRDIPTRAKGPASVYVKIQDGCSAPCAFCILPAIKGPYRSKPVQQVVAEVARASAAGAREVVLVAQDTTAYGYDWGQRDVLPDLLDAIVETVPELPWIRLMYAYPGHVSDRLVETMARHPQVCRYLDMPLQHAAPGVLRRMRRPGVEVARRNIARLRAALPDIALRTTFMVGFPGETEDEFAELLAFVEELQFDKLGVFTYSHEPGTAAHALADDVPEAVKEERQARLMERQQAISLGRNRAQIGHTLDVLIESVGSVRIGGPRRRRHHKREQPMVVGRSTRDAPEVDGLVFCQGQAAAGQMVRARVVNALPYDLVAEILT